MPKRTRSVFKPRKSYKTKFQAPKSKKVVPQIPPGTRIYETLNQITSMLSQTNGLLYGVMAPAPDILKDYLRRSIQELHALQKLLVDKLPENYGKDDEIAEHVEVPDSVPDDVKASIVEIETMLDSNWMLDDVTSTSVRDKALEDLTSLGLMPALRELSINKTQRAKNYVASNGGLKNACRKLADYWRRVRTTICDNNRHDPDEYRELKSALHDDLDDAYQFIETLVNNV